MATRAPSVSLITFAEKYFQVLKAGGTKLDLMNACEMKNIGSVTQKLVTLTKEWKDAGKGDLPSLKRSDRSPNKGESVGKSAVGLLADLMAKAGGPPTNTNNGQSNINELTQLVHKMHEKSDEFKQVLDKADKILDVAAKGNTKTAEKPAGKSAGRPAKTAKA